MLFLMNELLQHPLRSRMTAQTIVITGGTSGLGYSALEQIVARSDGPYRIIIGCRSKEKGEKAISNLKKLKHDEKTSIQTIPLDMSSFSSVQSFAKSLLNDEPLVLILNAGIAYPTRHVSSDDIEETLQVNVLSGHLLVKLLQTQISRVVFINSRLHLHSVRATANGFNVTPDTIEEVSGPRWSQMEMYRNSKLMQMHNYLEWQEHVPAIAVCPGFCPMSGLGRESGVGPGLFNYAMRLFPFTKSVSFGGKAIMDGVFLPIEKGKYYDASRGVMDDPDPETSDKSIRGKYWEYVESKTRPYVLTLNKTAE